MTILALLALMVILFYVFFIIPTKWLKVENINHDLGINKKVLQISDVHIKNLRISPRKLVEVIEKEKPDYIFLTGDIVDRHNSELELVDNLFSALNSTNVETYAVLGNHDRYMEDVQELEKMFQKHNIRLLKNEYVEKENFIIVGIDDCTHGDHDIKKSFGFEDKHKKRIVITHNAELVLENMENKFDYLMCGHLHGKQINLPYLYHFKPMGELAKMGIYKGKHETKNGTIYISKGIGQTRLNVRFLVRSEITIHHF